MGKVDWPSLVAALSFVERLADADSGLLSFGHGQGGIFIERGRVCWVAARGLQRRLRDLLSAHSGMNGAQLESIYQRCRAQGLMLGETLVAEGLVEAEALQRALRLHSAECLVELCHAPQPTSWASHSGRGYAPRFTFRALDLLLDSVALVYPELQRAARSELDKFSGRGRRGFAFKLDSDDSLLPLAESSGNSVEAMLAVRRTVAPIPRASRELGVPPAFTLSTTANGQTALVWWWEAALFTVLCEDRESVAAATAQHLACA